MDHVVMFSGGIGSWATATRVAEQHGTERLTLLFADTLVEDEDTYRFLGEAAENVGGKFVRVCDGRTPFEVFHDRKFIGSSRLAHCSQELKQIPCRQWLEDNCDPEQTILYVGIDWTETHRIPPIIHGWRHNEGGKCRGEHNDTCPQPCKLKAWQHCSDTTPCRSRRTAGWTIAAPLTEPPYIAKQQMISNARKAGLTPPTAYERGYPHANCLAQGCVRGGQAYWENLLRQDRDTYLATEAQEENIRLNTDWGTDATIMKREQDNRTLPMTLREFREGIERQPSMFDTLEWGGCGCFTDTPEENTP